MQIFFFWGGGGGGGGRSSFTPTKRRDGTNLSQGEWGDVHPLRGGREKS